MDGTLLNDDGIVSTYTQQTIQEAIKQDIKVVLSTGRPLAMCASYADELALTSFIITSNGAEVWTDRHTLFERHTMNAEKIEKLWHLGDANQFHMWMVASGALFPNSERPEQFGQYEWLKMGYGNLDEEAKQFLLNELADDPSIEISNSSVTNIEVNKVGVNKANAIQSICQKIGITMKEVLAVGDSLNDLKMIKQVGIGVAVANAQPVIMEAADHVTATNNEDGVAKAIEKFALV